MDSSDQRIDVFTPDPSLTKKGEAFPLIAFMHGFFGGGMFTNIYFPLVEAIASFGYVVAVPRACDLACFDDKASLPHDPLRFAHYYHQQIRVIEWAMEKAREEFEVFALVNSSAGVGIAGHSMGGQATLFTSALTNASKYPIKAAVMLHPFTHSFPAPTVPFLVLTGSKDELAYPWMAESFFNRSDACGTRAFVDKTSPPPLPPEPWTLNPKHRTLISKPAI